MKYLAQAIVIQRYGLVVTDELLLQWRMKNGDVSEREISNERLRAKLLKEHVADLIGPPDEPDAFFIYGRGSVCQFLRALHQLAD